MQNMCKKGNVEMKKQFFSKRCSATPLIESMDKVLIDVTLIVLISKV